MTTELLQGKRKREEEKQESEMEMEMKDQELPERIMEQNIEAENLITTPDIAEQPEQDQPLQLIKKTNTLQTAGSGNY